MENLELIISCFPKYGELIARRCRDDAAFREVCEDYADVWKALDLACQAPSDTSSQLVEEFEGMLQELETEVVEAVLLQEAGVFRAGPPPLNNASDQ